MIAPSTGQPSNPHPADGHQPAPRGESRFEWLRRKLWLHEFDVPEEHQEAFSREMARVGGVALGPYCLLGSLLVPAFLGLDYLLYPDMLPELGIARAITTAVALLLFAAIWWTNKKGATEQHFRTLTVLFALVFVGGLDVVIMMVGGMDTPYYAGMALILLALSSGLPLRVGEMTILLLAIVLQLNVAEFVLDEEINIAAVVNANFFLLGTVIIGIFINAIAQRLRVVEFIARQETERLLLNILPREVAEELRRHDKVEVRKIEWCSILFTDFVGFTSMSEHVDPKTLVEQLDHAFSRFDTIADQYGLEKLKTIGDSYMCAGGVLGSQPDHLVACILAGLEMLEALEVEQLRAPDGTRWRMRIGIHCGPVVAGVIGKSKFAYDLWGDTVNTASRLEATGLPASINLAHEVYEAVERFFVAEDRGFIPVRGKGPIRMAGLHRLRGKWARDASGRFHNKELKGEISRVLDEDSTALLPSEGHRARLPLDELLPNEADPLATFSMLIPEDRERLLEVAEYMHWGQGKILIEEGQGLSVLFLVIRGLFGVKINRGGIDIQVAVLGPGEIVGELSFVSLEPASATVEALEDATVMRFDLDKLQRMNAEMPGLGARLFHSFAVVLARRVREANARLFSAGESSDDERETEELVPAPTPMVPMPSLPSDLLESMTSLQLTLHPLSEVSGEQEAELGRDVHATCDRLVSLLCEAHDRSPERAEAMGMVLRHEAHRFLSRSRMLARLGPQGRCDHLQHAAIEGRLPASEDPLGRHIDAWFLQQPFCTGVRSGIELMAHQLREAYVPNRGTWRVASLACGAAPEIFAALQSLNPRTNLRVTCVDSAMANLSAVGARATSLAMHNQFGLVQADAFGHRAMRKRLRMAPQQMLYVSVLPATVTDSQLERLLREARALLDSDGSLLLGQLWLPTPSRLFLQHLLGVTLRMRTPEELGPIANRTGYGSAVIQLPAAAEGTDRYRCVALRT